jgi:hypothetical protein
MPTDLPPYDVIGLTWNKFRSASVCGLGKAIVCGVKVTIMNKLTTWEYRKIENLPPAANSAKGVRALRV